MNGDKDIVMELTKEQLDLVNFATSGHNVNFVPRVFPLTDGKDPGRNY